jgi:hypothetical protein
MTTDDSSVNDLLRSLSQDLSSLVRNEIQLARAEVVAKSREAGRGAALLAGSGVLGALATGMSGVYVLRVLDRWLPPRTAAFVATSLYGAGAAGLARAGLAELRRVGPPVPERTLSSVRDDVDALRPGSGPETGPGASGAGG